MVRAATVAGVVAVASLLTVTPAAAWPFWQKWVPTSDYTCGPTTNHWKSKNVIFQTCIIRGSGKNMQPVMLVRNNASVDIETYGRVHAGWNPNTFAYCHDSNLSAGALTACYGKSSSGKVGNNYGWGELYMNGVNENPSETLMANYWIPG
ncbi:hypothetical protein ACPEIF_06010 [Streptomyces sp. NPDC012600]|uniref:hypothetical protein n=1 Tax=Streptomyces sp. NPDC012600 TaxID=3415005 RepID=UPI003C2BDF74